MKTKVLIVDDEPININILNEILSEKMEVLEAVNGNDALVKVAEFMPDIVLLDVMMPELDGLEVCRRIRKDERFNYIKIILVSAKTMQNEKLEGYDAGADDYITKPFDDEELLAKVNVFAKLKTSEELNKLKSTFINLISHETGTPLNAITGLTGILLEDEDLSEDNRELVEEINNSAVSLAERINRLLLLVKAKSSDDCDMQIINTHDLISSVLTEVSHKNYLKNTKINCGEIISAQLSCCIESLQQAICFVIENSVKRSTTTPEILIDTKLSDSKDMFLIEITDQGSIIDERAIHNLFDDFFVPDILYHNSGFGVELAISKAVITMHRGKIFVSNNDNSGVTFTISLPIVTE